MNFWSLVNGKWSRQQMEGWGSVRKTLYILLPLFLYYLIHDVAEILLWGGLNQLMSTGSRSFNEALNAHAHVVRGGISALAILIALGVLFQAVKAEIGLPWEHTISGVTGEEKRRKGQITAKQLMAYVILGMTAIASSLSLNLLLNLIGLVKSSAAFSEVAAAQYGVEFWVGILLYGILSPLAEEIIFRGLIYHRMKRCFGMSVALLISSLLFGCYHGNLVQGIYGFLMGLLIAFAYERYQSFAAPLLFHAVSNMGIYTMTSFHMLGGQKTEASILEMLIAAGIAAFGVYLIWAGGRREENSGEA